MSLAERIRPARTYHTDRISAPRGRTSCEFRYSIAVPLRVAELARVPTDQRDNPEVLRLPLRLLEVSRTKAARTIARWGFGCASGTEA
jgi:hypothetical protein